jgi:polar amino acid transport system substrate-binding protein
MNNINRLAYQLFCGSIALALGSASTMARETDFVVHASHIPEYMITIGSTLDQSSGLMMEIAAAAFKNANVPVRVAPAVPWPRAQSRAMEAPGGILVLLARTPAREDRWRWLSVAYTDRVYAYTMKGKADFSSYEEIKATLPRVGVKLGSASESLLKGMAVKVDAVVNMEQNFKMLLLDRLDVVVVQGMEAFPAIGAVEAQREEVFNSRLPDLRRTSIAVLPLWFVTSKKTPEADARRLQEALERFKKTLEYTAIIRKYEGRLNAIGQ